MAIIQHLKLTFSISCGTQHLPCILH